MLALVCLLANLPPASGKQDETGYGTRLLALINQYRADAGGAPLAADPALHELALEHSREMAARGRLGHQGFAGRFERARRSACVENVGWNHPTPSSQLEAWIGSAGHRANLLDARVRAAGVARAGAYMTFFACD